MAGAPPSPRTTHSTTCVAARAAWRSTSSRPGPPSRGVVVCHDRRFASEHFARACVEVLAAHDIRSFTPPDCVPTQVGSFFTRELGAGAGIVITASHNPWTDNGFKVKADTGGAAAPEMLAAIEATMDTHPEDELPPRREYDDAVAAGLVETFDPYPRFRDQLLSIVDIERIRAAERRVLVEDLYGSGSGWFTRLLGGGRADGRRAPHRAQSVLRRREPRADPPEHRRVAGGDPALARATSGSPSTATPTGSGWPPRRASSSTSCRCTACCTGTCSRCAARSVRRSTP